jgi:DNA-binding MarR family transcriptional regulator
MLSQHNGRCDELSLVALSILYNATIKKTSVSDVSEDCGIRKSTASLYVDSLEKKGLVRLKHDEPARTIYIEPTARGKSLIAEYEKKLSKYVEKGMVGLKPAEQEKIVELIAIFSGVDEK